MIFIYPSIWDAEMHRLNGAPEWREAAHLLAVSGFSVVIITARGTEGHQIPFRCSDDELAAIEWLVPGEPGAVPRIIH